MNAPIEDNGLVTWTLYERPLDYPTKLVLRRGFACRLGYIPDIFPSIVSPATADNRKAILEWMDVPWLNFISRFDGDHKSVIGVWL